MTKGSLTRQLPPLLLSLAVAGASVSASGLLRARYPWFPDAVVLGLLLGLQIRALFPALEGFDDAFKAIGRYPLELAIVLLGITTNPSAFAPLGLALALGVIGTVAVALAAGVFIGRRSGLTPTHALLVASGNAICGNSAIAAVARVIRAPAAESASSIALTAVLSIVLVLTLPLGSLWLGLSDVQYGVWAGLTVYAVPQVLAATFPVSETSGEIGTLVKLARVLLLAPLLIVVARLTASAESPALKWRTLLPPYLALFLVGAAANGVGLVPSAAVPTLRSASHLLTVLAMTAIGLNVRWSSLRAVGARTAVATVLSMIVLTALALATAVTLSR